MSKKCYQSDQLRYFSALVDWLNSMGNWKRKLSFTNALNCSQYLYTFHCDLFFSVLLLLRKSDLFNHFDKNNWLTYAYVM